MEMSMVEKGVRFTVKIGKQQYSGTILDFAFSSEGDYYQCKCELEKQNLITGEIMKSIYPKPIQSYKLHRIRDGKSARYSQTPTMSDADIISQIAVQLEN